MRHFTEQFKTEHICYTDYEIGTISNIIDEKFNRVIALYQDIPHNVELYFEEFRGCEYQSLIINDKLVALAFIRRKDFINYEILITYSLQTLQMSTVNRNINPNS